MTGPPSIAPIFTSAMRLPITKFLLLPLLALCAGSVTAPQLLAAEPAQGHTEMLSNGDFANGMAPWSLDQSHGASARTACVKEGPDGQAALRLEVTGVGDKTWRLQLFQTGFKIQQGRRYVMSFWAKADRPVAIGANCMQNHEPWNHATQTPVELTREWKHVVFPFAGAWDETNPRVTFTNLGSTPGQVYWFADCSLKPGEDASQSTISSVPGNGPVRIVGRASYRTPSEAFKNAKDGDRIEIQAGKYNDVGILRANNVTVVGVGGRPIIDGKGAIADGHGIWVIDGNNTTLDNFEMLNEDNGLRGEAAWDQAAVYLKGNNLTMNHMFIHDNLQGFFNRTKSGDTCDLIITNSIFDTNGDGGGHSHNLYVNHNITNLTMRGVWSRNCIGGHILKVRAFRSDIQGCLFTDSKGLSLGWFIDFPDGGNHKFVGNIVEHNNGNPGSTMLAFGEDVPNPIPNYLLIAQNTFVNDGNGQFLDKIQKVTAIIEANIFVGSNAPTIVHNQIAPKSELNNPTAFDFRVPNPYQGTINFAAFAYADGAKSTSRTDSVYGGYFPATATPTVDPRP